MNNKTNAASERRLEYDYIVVGSGAGGAPLAVNLAQAGYRVSVLADRAGAVSQAKSLFRRHDASAEFIEADLLAPPKGLKRYDLVWTAGVLDELGPC